MFIVYTSKRIAVSITSALWLLPSGYNTLLTQTVRLRFGSSEYPDVSITRAAIET